MQMRKANENNHHVTQDYQCVMQNKKHRGKHKIRKIIPLINLPKKFSNIFLGAELEVRDMLESCYYINKCFIY